MTNIHGKPIAERIDWVFDLARRHGETSAARKPGSRASATSPQHPTAIAVLKCMDGRINIPAATNTPTGTMMPFRNLGGIFDLGWPHLGEVLASHVQRTVDAGRRVLVLITYHWSKGDPQRGCAGFDYDPAAAIAHTCEIHQQVEHIFGSGHATVYPLVCGFETDEDALVIHGADGACLDLAAFAPGRHRDAGARASPACCRTCRRSMRADLLPLLRGNLERIAEVREQARRNERMLDVEHREWMICVGRGFEFLHAPNLALIIGPYSPNLAVPIRTAGSILKNNMSTGRIPDDGFLLLASVPYDEIGVDRARAELKSRFLSSFAASVLRDDHPGAGRQDDHAHRGARLAIPDPGAPGRRVSGTTGGKSGISHRPAR